VAAPKFAQAYLESAVIDFGKFVVFKPISGGYVYRAPNRWLFGSQQHFRVNDAQKAAILATVNTSGQPVLWITGIAWILQSALFGTALSLWAHRSGSYTAELSGVLAAIATILSVYPAFVISRQLLLRRLRPILAGLSPSSDRITNLEERRAIRAISAPLSPGRRRIAIIAGVVTMAATLGAMIVRAIDTYQPDQPELLALWSANANLYGVFNIATIVAFGFAIVNLVRNSKPE
jgi:hypothetical protein